MADHTISDVAANNNRHIYPMPYCRLGGASLSVLHVADEHLHYVELDAIQ